MKHYYIIYILFGLIALSPIIYAQDITSIPLVQEYTADDLDENIVYIYEPQGEYLVASSLTDDDLQVAQDDPAYPIYRKGYNYILDEEWKEAIKRFEEVIKKYAKSEYVDDARYWYAYALKHVDYKKAVDYYKNFIKTYPKSRYYDDAIADLNEMETGMYVSEGGDSIVLIPAPEVNIPRAIFAPNVHIKKLERSMKMQSRSLSKANNLTFGIGKNIFVNPKAWTNKKIDPETQVKLDALYALGNSKNDEKSFTILKDIAENSKQPKDLRGAALDALSDFNKYDVVSVYVDIAKKDTDEDLQGLAIDYISEHGKDKYKTVITLIDLFEGLPKNRKQQRETIFYSIAEIGNEKAVDFLSNIARTYDDYKFRSEAVYYLGSIGGEKARTVLMEILKGK